MTDHTDAPAPGSPQPYREPTPWGAGEPPAEADGPAWPGRAAQSGVPPQSGYAAQSGVPPQSGYAAQPSYSPQPVPPSPPVFTPASAPPASGPPASAPPVSAFAGPAAGLPAPPQLRRPRNVAGWLALALALVLLAVAIVQTVFVMRLSDRVDRQADELRTTNTRLAETQSDLDAANKQLAGVDDRTKGALNSAAVASKVLPAVFRVRAGRATGTAFAFGTPSAGGGTLLVTNFHVVEGVVEAGSRRATLERGAERHPVTIVKMDERRDLAILQSTKAFPRLSAATVAVRPGQPVVVVGAPLGLADTVTTGVVSAVRADVPGLDARVIQFDAAISPGNSGGPVSNADGQVVGVAQAKIVRDDADGLALAIPISEVCDGLVDC